MFRVESAGAVPMLLAPRVSGVLWSAAPPAHKARATRATSAAGWCENRAYSWLEVGSPGRNGRRCAQRNGAQQGGEG